MTTEPEFWWRAEDRRYCGVDEWGDPLPSYLKIEMHKYQVLRHTPKGVWLSYGFGGEIFVPGKAKKQFAVPTQELALLDLIARKKVHVDACKGRLRRAEEHLRGAEHELLKLDKGRPHV